MGFREILPAANHKLLLNVKLVFFFSFDSFDAKLVAVLL